MPCEARSAHEVASGIDPEIHPHEPALADREAVGERGKRLRRRGLGLREHDRRTLVAVLALIIEWVGRIMELVFKPKGL